MNDVVETATALTGVTRLADYAPPAFLVDSIALTFDLDPAQTVVRSRLGLRRNPAAQGAAPLHLHEEALTRGTILLDDAPLDPSLLRVVPGGIEIDGIGAEATLDIQTTIAPDANTELSGLYRSGGNYFTQCEAEGFRRITCFPDRPDVMARFTTTIIADRTTCPVLLSNGNRVDGGDLPGGRHWAKWEDPHPKPSYLFALVAGDLTCVADRFTTRSGREIELGIYVRAGDEGRCGHAMQVLKDSMTWDEQVFGLEYDLGVFNIAAVSDFNMGAMENKGLNVFNTKYVLADANTATDADYQGIETVISHEYFHNWTGNRVTCRDWFQLSLKEGLTVFRDQEFSADQGSRAVKRIEDVRRLRASQFPEDAGPLAHPVRPESYVKIDNFYTATVYQKGAEVVRMIRTLVGPTGFRAGMDLYFQRHDNQAVRIEDFAQAMQDASGVDLTQFRHWYAQAGTPEISAEDSYDADSSRYTLTLRQHTDPTPGQPTKRALLIPVAMGLLGSAGEELPTRLAGENTATSGTRVLRFTEAEQSFVFEDVTEPPTPSLLRDFSAPVRLAPQSPERLRFLAAHDTDPFVRWDSGQRYASRLLLEGVTACASGQPMVLDDGLVAAMRAVLSDAQADPAFAALALSLPGEAFLADQMAIVDVVHIHQAREWLRAALGTALAAPLREAFAAMSDDDAPYRPDGRSIGRRSLKNTCLAYLCAAGNTALVEAQYAAGRNMTDVLAALSLLNTTETAARAAAFADFYDRFHHDDLVLDKWFALQAVSPLPDTLERVRTLTTHKDFSWRNPNRLRALVASFAMANPLRFHAADGSGYDFLADAILQTDPINSQTAARMTPPLGQWRRQPPGNAALMRAALQRLLDSKTLSAATAELAVRSLG
jgi:aminopeptidase N